MMLGKLSLLSGPQQGRTVFVLKGLTVFEVGRAPGAHVKLTDGSVAMNHCRLYRKEEEYTLYALSDQRPSLVNGKKAKKTPLSSGDRITLGSVEFLFELVTEEQAEESLRQDAESPPATAENSEPPAAAPAGACLVVLDGENRGMTFSLTGKSQVKIGRSSSNDIRLPDVKVSRDHCLIEQLEGHYIIVDLESANGTIVNGERVRKTVLQSNDFLRLGFTVLKFQSDT